MQGQGKAWPIGRFLLGNQGVLQVPNRKQSSVDLKLVTLLNANSPRTIAYQRIWRQALALVACAVLLYFATGGALLHQHTGGSENACHVCQALHIPALAASANLVAVPEVVTRYCEPVQNILPSSSFSLHRAGRAPPTA